jgi:multidrug efflux pump subunit AcrB
VTENIARHMALEPDRGAAIRAAVGELVWPVTTSTLTTVVVFLPLGLLQGVVGQFFHALSVTLAIAVGVSLVLALTLIPLLSEEWLAPAAGAVAGSTPSPTGLLDRMARAGDALADRYERSLAVALGRPRALAAGALALIVAGYLAQRAVGTGFLPEMDEGAFVLDYWSPGGTALSETDRQVHLVEQLLAATPEVVGSSRRTGAELGLFATEQNRGDLVVRLSPESRRSRSSFAIIDDLRGRIESALPRLHVEFVQILSDVVNDLAGATRPVEIKLFGSELGQLEAFARRLEPKLGAVAGLEDLYNGVSEPSAEMAMRVDAAEAARIGLSPVDVGAAASAALLGASAGEIRLEDRSIAVRVRAPDSVRYDPLRLTALPIVAPLTRRATPLGSLARFQPRETRGELIRENQQQTITLTGDVSGRALGDVMSDVQRVLAENPAPPGVRVELGGQYAGQQEAFRALLLVLGLAAASVIAVMVVQFESFVEPLASFMGLILLVGLIVKNGIILLDFTRHRMLAEGLALEPAIREAARVRLRPILMTTLCTLFGLAPLALGIGAGSELQRPLALAVIGGLALSTPITLYVVPTLLVAVRGRDYTLERRQG